MLAIKPEDAMEKVMGLIAELTPQAC